MTTNQTINGVPRALLENFASYAEGSASGEVQQWVKKLRALLDAPAATPVPAAWIRFDQDQKAIFTRGKRSNDSEPLYLHPTAYRMPTTQPQGEPVGFRYRAHGGPWELMPESPFADGRTHHRENGEELQPLYAEQSAPVAVVKS